jgi:hypothetical protein
VDLAEALARKVARVGSLHERAALPLRPAASTDRGASPEMPRTRREMWERHVRWVRLQTEAAPWKAALLEMMLERQRDACANGRFPFGQLPAEARPTDDEIRKAITECIAENGGRHIGRDELWRRVQHRFPWCQIPQKAVRQLMPKRDPGRPRKT